MSLFSTSPLVKKYSLKEFWDLSEPRDGSKLELIAGVLYMTPPPDFPHNFSSSSLVTLFSIHLHSANMPGMIFTPRAALWIDPATYVEPDLFYISTRTLKQIDWKKPHTADLAVEIISPGSAIYDRNTKADTYAAMGVRELWLVDPEQGVVEVRHLKRGTKQYSQGVVFLRGERVVSKVLPDFSPSVTDICKQTIK
jgi:Uma2 family endonuclease